MQTSRPTYGQKSLGNSGASSHTDNTSMSNNTLGFLGAAGAGMGEVMNVKKWSWPGALTFGKAGSDSRSKSSPRARTAGSQDTLPGQFSAQASTRVVRVDERVTDAQVVPALRDHGVEGDVDQSALDDAISSEAAPVIKTELKADNETLHAHEHRADMPPSLTTLPTDAAVSNALFGADSSSLYTTSLTRAHAFSVSSIYLSEPLQPLAVRRGQVLHMSVRAQSLLPSASA